MRVGFSLVELVVVILVTGVIAAVAAPKMFNAAGDARENALVHSLGVVRDAIELHRATTGKLPGEAGTEADFKADLAPFLRKFPKNPLIGSDAVAVQSDGAEMKGTVAGRVGWRYDNVTGTFVANSSEKTSDGSARFWEL